MKILKLNKITHTYLGYHEKKKSFFFYDIFPNANLLLKISSAIYLILTLRHGDLKIVCKYNYKM